MLARQLLLLLLVVPVLAVVHDTAHRRVGVRRDLDEVEILGPRVLEGFVARLDADLRPVVVDQPHLRYADRLIDPGARLGRTHILATARPHWRFTECFNLLLSRVGAPPGVRAAVLARTRRGEILLAGGWETGDASTLTT